MKPSVQVRNNHRTEKQTSQAQQSGKGSSAKAGAAEFAISENENSHPSCLVIFDRVSQKPVSKIPLIDQEFQKLLELQALPICNGISIEGVIAAGIRNEMLSILRADNGSSHVRVSEIGERSAKKSSQVPTRVQVDDAISIMESTGLAACALLMLDAERIRAAYQNDSGWEPLDFPGLEKGIMELAHIVIANFQMEFAKFARYLRGESKCNWEFEDAVGALRDLLSNFSKAISDRRNSGHQISHCSGQLLYGRLRKSFDQLWDIHAALSRNEIKPIEGAA